MFNEATFPEGLKSKLVGRDWRIMTYPADPVEGLTPCSATELSGQPRRCVDRENVHAGVIRITQIQVARLKGLDDLLQGHRLIGNLAQRSSEKSDCPVRARKAADQDSKISPSDQTASHRRNLRKGSIKALAPIADVPPKEIDLLGQTLGMFANYILR
jgi:hypothetical protein